MPSQFSRLTILAATDMLANFSHAALTRFLLEYSLDEVGDAGSLRDRANAIARHLLRNPDFEAEDGRNLADAIVTRLVEDELKRVTDLGGFHYDWFCDHNAGLQRALERDGLTVEDGTLRRTLPETIDLPAADNEVHALLGRFGFRTPLGHLEQAIAAHGRADWAAANGQLRSFTESLFDQIAATLAPVGSTPATGHPSRQWLAQSTPPFFYANLNEWSGNGNGFFEAFFRRLHPQGAHPGLSDEEDSTFRLHLVLLTARLILRRFAALRP